MSTRTVPLTSEERCENKNTEPANRDLPNDFTKVSLSEVIMRKIRKNVQTRNVDLETKLLAGPPFRKWRNKVTTCWRNSKHFKSMQTIKHGRTLWPHLTVDVAFASPANQFLEKEKSIVSMVKNDIYFPSDLKNKKLYESKRQGSTVAQRIRSPRDTKSTSCRAVCNPTPQT